MKYEKMANGYGDTVESTIQHMVKIITSKFNPQSIILIGSHARGDANKHSDIDLLVVVDACDNNKETRIKMGAALHASPYPKDIIFTTPKMIANYEKVPGTIQRAALLEGIKLYER